VTRYLLLTIPLFTACMVGEDEATDGTSGVSVGTVESGLTGCHGHASSEIPADGDYVITTFGGPGDHQQMSCGGYADGTTWYAASRQRYGCGSKIQIEANGKCVVATALDYGPDVCVENAAHSPVIDVSPLVSKALFGVSGAGWSDHLHVNVTPVAAGTPVGPCATSGEDPPPPSDDGTQGGAATCESSTLDREVDDGTCVQSVGDGKWYQCENGGWDARASSAGCETAFGFCHSATLGRDVPPRTCVQAASNGVWYQCNGQAWVTPVSTSNRIGPIGDCATWNPL